MTLNRRRFLAITAASTIAPHAALASHWSGRGFGADLGITLYGPTEVTEPALQQARMVLSDIERLFSLYDPRSALSKLNATGRLPDPNNDFLAVLRAADDAHHSTEGLFDPTVQSFWSQGVQDRLPTSNASWVDVIYSSKVVRLGKGQQLTFNGIAQGFATDRVTEVLANHGLKSALVNIGEFRAIGGPWTLGVSDPIHGQLATRQLDGTAIATSSASALTLNGRSHIMHKTAIPKWSTVSVEATTATAADSLSTALVLATQDQIKRIKARREDVKRVTIIDEGGDLMTI